MRSAITMLVFGTALGCASTPRVVTPISVMFNPAEMAWSKGTGTAAIEGQAFLKTRGGDVKYGAGNAVLLLPATTYSSEWAQRMIAGGDMPDLDDRAQEYARRTTADGQGRFRFAELPAGEYIVLTTVTWEIPGVGRYSGMSTQGGAVGMKVQATSGKTETVIVTR